MKAFYSDKYVIPLPPQHRFPIAKYVLIRQRLEAEGVLKPHQIFHPPLVERDEALLVHTADYYDRLVAGEVTDREIRRPRLALGRTAGRAFAGVCWGYAGCGSCGAGRWHRGKPRRRHASRFRRSR